MTFLVLVAIVAAVFHLVLKQLLNRNVMINGLHIQILLLIYWFMINMAQIEDMFMDFIPYTALSTFILTLSLFKKNFFFLHIPV